MKFHFLKPVLLMKKIITSSEERNKIPIRFYINNQGQGARKISHALSCHELQSLFWEFSQRLGIFPYKQNYISFLSCLITGMQAIAASFPGQSVMPRDPEWLAGVWVSLFAHQGNVPLSGHMLRQPSPQTTPGWGISCVAISGIPPLPTETVIFSVWRQGLSFLRTH